ncbi:hypothetical protein [Sulfurimonas sp. HSL-1716]|uniref:hypothetical protein n=1 Tax=Hydrocurvibacter sulfurireducens TaxID=3131937 RepID=UPI0031F9992D
MSAKIYLSEVDMTKEPLRYYDDFVDIKDRLIEYGIDVVEEEIDIDEFKSWLKEFTRINTQYQAYGEVHIEKCLEHYLSYKVLDFKTTDIFMDIAASGSQYADDLYYGKKVKQTYVLDLSYPEGIHGNKIGANAGDTKLPDEFIDKMGMHCAYECFEGKADIEYLSEAQRILKPKGRFVILPLYLDKTYFNCTSDKCDQKNVSFDEDAAKVWRDDVYAVPFARHYSAKIFYERIFKNLPKGIKGKIIFYKNLPELMKEFDDQRVYCYFAFVGEKI